MDIRAALAVPSLREAPGFKNHSQNVFPFPELKLIAELPGGCLVVEQAVVLRGGF